MFKLIITVKRRAGLSLAEFKDYYAKKHLPLLGSVLPHTDRGPKSFQQHFIQGDHPFLKVVADDRTDPNPPFDCISEIVFEQREDAEAAMKSFFDPQYLPVILADERKFVDPRSIRYYVVES